MGSAPGALETKKSKAPVRGPAAYKDKMTFAEIFASEDCNTDKIYLYRVGNFMKAYEHSAFLFHRWIKDFKLSYRMVKKENRYVVSLGFPESVKGKWLHDYPVHEVRPDVFVCDIAKKVDEAEYAQWLEMARLQANAGDRYTVHTSLIERQPVFKTAYDLLLNVCMLMEHVAKTLRSPFASESLRLATDIAYGVSVLYDTPDRNESIDKIREDCHYLAFILRVLKDRKQISSDSFAFCSERIVSVSKQLDALRKTVKA